MEFTCQRDALVRGIGVVERAVATRDTQPALTGILIEAREDRLRLVATDLELGIDCWVPAQVKEKGRTVLEGKYFIPMMRKLPGEEVSFTWDPERQLATITAGKARFQMNTLPSKEFPELPEHSGPLWKVPQSTLRKAIRQTSFAVAHDDARPAMGGILVELGEGFQMVATDGSRLAFRKGAAEVSQIAGAAQEAAATAENVSFGIGIDSAIVPARALNEVARLCEDDEAPVSLGFSKNLLTVRWESATLVSRLIDGQFPNYRQVLAGTFPNRIRVDRASLLSAVERAALITKKGPAIVVLDVADGVLTVSAREDEVGEAREEIPVEHSGEALRVAYQARFLTEMLRNVDSEQVELELGDPTRQGTWHPIGDEGYRYVVMPVRMP